MNYTVEWSWCSMLVNRLVFVADDTELRYDPSSSFLTQSEKLPDRSVVKCEPAESTQDASGATNSAAEWYHCETCDIYFRSVVMYTIHAGAHSRRNPLECNVCGRVSRDCYEFAAHLSYGDHCRVAASHPTAVIWYLHRITCKLQLSWVDCMLLWWIPCLGLD